MPVRDGWESSRRGHGDGMGPDGMFMDALRRGLPQPPAAQTLGFTVLDVDPTAGRIEVAFDGRAAFANPFGEVLGGFLAAMLYDTVGPALLATLGPGEFISTREMRVQFVRPARVGRFVGKGRIVSRVGERVLLEATLVDADGEPVAMADATAEVVHRPPPLAPPSPASPSSLPPPPPPD